MLLITCPLFVAHMHTLIVFPLTLYLLPLNIAISCVYFTLLMYVTPFTNIHLFFMYFYFLQYETFPLACFMSSEFMCVYIIVVMFEDIIIMLQCPVSSLPAAVINPQCMCVYVCILYVCWFWYFFEVFSNFKLTASCVLLLLLYTQLMICCLLFCIA